MAKSLFLKLFGARQRVCFRATITIEMCVSGSIFGNKVGNTESRRAELVQALLAILEERKLSRHEALKLRDRLQFVAGNIFGRIAKTALAVSRCDAACLQRACVQA